MSKAGVGTFVTEDHELASSGLALFDLPIVDTSLVSGKFVTIYPRTVLSSAGPNEFTIPSDGQDFTDLPYTRLEGCLEVLKADGTKLTDTEVNAYVNLLPQSLFKQIELYINNTQISDISAPVGVGNRSFNQQAEALDNFINSGSNWHFDKAFVFNIEISSLRPIVTGEDFGDENINTNSIKNSNELYNPVDTKNKCFLYCVAQELYGEKKKPNKQPNQF